MATMNIGEIKENITYMGIWDIILGVSA